MNTHAKSTRRAGPQITCGRSAVGASSSASRRALSSAICSSCVESFASCSCSRSCCSRKEGLRVASAPARCGSAAGAGAGAAAAAAGCIACPGLGLSRHWKMERSAPPALMSSSWSGGVPWFLAGSGSAFERSLHLVRVRVRVRVSVRVRVRVRVRISGQGQGQG